MKNYLLYSRVHPNSLESIVEVKAIKYRQTNQNKFKKVLSRHVLQEEYTKFRSANGRTRRFKIYTRPQVGAICGRFCLPSYTAPSFDLLEWDESRSTLQKSHYGTWL